MPLAKRQAQSWGEGQMGGTPVTGWFHAESEILSECFSSGGLWDLGGLGKLIGKC